MKKELTLDDLAQSIEKGFVLQDKKIDAAFEDFAIMVQKGFGAQDKRINDVIRTIQEGFKETDERFIRLEKLGLELKSGQQTTHDRLNAIDIILSPLMLAVDLMKRADRDHEMRIARLEKLLLKK